MEDAAAAQDLCKTIFATLREYTDKQSCRAVERAVSVALRKSPVFLKGFAGLVAKAAEKGELGVQQRLVLTRWSCLVIDHLDTTEFAGAFAKIAQVQGGLLAGAALAQCAPAPQPCGAFQHLLRRRPELLSAYLSHLGEGSKSFVTTAPLAACGLAAELLHHAVVADPAACPPPSTRRAGRCEKNQSKGGARRLGDDAPAAARAAALDVYIRVVFGGDAKVKLPPAVGCILSPLAATITHDEFAEKVAPAVVKQLKRSPEGVLRSTRSLLETTSLDLSRYAVQLFEPLLSQVKHADEWRRAEAVGAIAAVASSSTNVDATRAGGGTGG